MGKTFSEKILAAKAGLDEVVAGQIVIVKPDHLLTHDNTAAIIDKIGDALDEYGVVDPNLPAIILDHVIPAANEKTAANHQAIRAYVEKQGIKNFFDVGYGVCHQVMIEQGLARPGRVIVGSDSHTCSYGAVGAFSTGIDRTEAAALLLRGETWLKVPTTIKVELSGELQPGVSAKDIVLTIIGTIGSDGATYQAVEFHGDGVATLTMDDRITIANMGIEMGAKAAVFPIDDVATAYLSKIGLGAGDYTTYWADADAKYSQVLRFDLAQLQPVVAAPHKVDNMKPVSELKGMAFDQLLLGTCTNGRLSDFHAAVKVLEGKKVSSKTRLLLLPASREILEAALADGTIAKLVAAGGVLLPPGCGPCLGAHQGAMAPGEKTLSTANRNFKGRMGCKEAEIYLASAETVAATALTGELADPREVF